MLPCGPVTLCLSQSPGPSPALSSTETSLTGVTREGETGRFRVLGCRLTHTPLSPSGERILASGSIQLPRFTLLESGSLLVSPTHISDAGTYTCLATNSRGVDEASADLVVWGECLRLGASHVCARVSPSLWVPMTRNTKWTRS
jgi:hypothetical protein